MYSPSPRCPSGHAPCGQGVGDSGSQPSNLPSLASTAPLTPSQSLPRCTHIHSFIHSVGSDGTPSSNRYPTMRKGVQVPSINLLTQLCGVPAIQRHCPQLEGGIQLAHSSPRPRCVLYPKAVWQVPPGLAPISSIQGFISGAPGTMESQFPRRRAALGGAGPSGASLHPSRALSCKCLSPASTQGAQKPAATSRCGDSSPLSQLPRDREACRVDTMLGQHQSPPAGDGSRWASWQWCLHRKLMWSAIPHPLGVVSVSGSDGRLGEGGNG